MMNSEQQYNYNNNNNNMKEICDPKWILDRRNSGRLFWRRDSGNFKGSSDADDSNNRRNHTSSMNRVKFRCDVEVLEFWKQEYEQSSSSSSLSDEYSDEDDCYGFRGRRDKWRTKQPWRSKQDEDVATPSTLIVGFLLAVLLVFILYQWMNEQASVAV